MNELKYYAKDLITPKDKTLIDCSVEYFTQYIINESDKSFTQINSIISKEINSLKILGELIKETNYKLMGDKPLHHINYADENNYFRKLNEKEERILIDALHGK